MLNKDSKLFKKWIKALKSSDYRETIEYPAMWLTKPKEFAYNPLGVLFKVSMSLYPSQYSIHYKEESRARNGGYKICTLRDDITKRAYLVDLPYAIYSLLDMDSQGFAIYYDRLRDENQYILAKKIARIGERMSMDIAATAGTFKALNNIQSVLSYRRESFSLSDAAVCGLSHKVIAVLLSEAGDSDLKHHTIHDINELRQANKALEALEIAAD